MQPPVCGLKDSSEDPGPDLETPDRPPLCSHPGGGCPVSGLQSPSASSILDQSEADNAVT